MSNFPPPPYGNQQPAQQGQYTQAPQQLPQTQPQAPMYQPQQTLPQNFQVDPEAIRRDLEEATKAHERSGKGPERLYFKFLNPQGQVWKGGNVFQNYAHSATLFFLPPMPGKNFTVNVGSIFWKSHKHPNGTAIGYVPNGLIDQARKLALDSGDPTLIERAKQRTRRRIKHYFNVLWLDAGPEAHQFQGQPRPFLFEMGSELLADWQNQTAAFPNFFHPQQGHPFIITKRKTGPQDMDVKYSVVVGNQGQPTAIPEWAYSILNNQWDLAELQDTPDQAREMEALQSMELAHLITGHAQPAYQATPQPPQQNPYNSPAPQAQNPSQAIQQWPGFTQPASQQQTTTPQWQAPIAPAQQAPAPVWQGQPPPPQQPAAIGALPSLPQAATTATQYPPINVDVNNLTPAQTYHPAPSVQAPAPNVGSGAPAVDPELEKKLLQELAAK